MIDYNEIPGSPEYLHFKNESEGYMFCSNGDVYDSDASLIIYKTTDGGKSWEQIVSVDGYVFYGDSELYNNAIFGSIKSWESMTKNKLFKLDLLTQEFKLLDFTIERLGNIWTKNDSVYLDFINDNVHYNMLKTDTDFSSYSLMPFSYIPKSNSVIGDSANTYFITWENQFVIETNNQYKEIEIQKPTCITKIDKDKILIAANQYKPDAINLFQYDLTNDQLEKLHTFENYSIIKYLQSNENVIVGFLGNIGGMFVDYDLVYSTDQGKTWQIQKLKDSLMISPNCLVDNILYIYSGDRLQKITFD